MEKNSIIKKKVLIICACSIFIPSVALAIDPMGPFNAKPGPSNCTNIVHKITFVANAIVMAEET